jgi:hypothetical protein
MIQNELRLVEQALLKVSKITGSVRTLDSHWKFRLWTDSVSRSFQPTRGAYRDRISELISPVAFIPTVEVKAKMTQQTESGHPMTAAILAFAGSILMIVSGTLFLAVSTFILPHLDVASFRNVQVPSGLAPGSIPAIASGVVGTMGLFGLASGIIVLVSAVILLTNRSQVRTWGVLILVFSVLSLLGTGGFAVGAILGIVSGILTLRWKPSPPVGSGAAGATRAIGEDYE